MSFAAALLVSCCKSRENQYFLVSLIRFSRTCQKVKAEIIPKAYFTQNSILAGATGCIINTPGWVTGLGFRMLLHAVQTFKGSILFDWILTIIRNY